MAHDLKLLLIEDFAGIVGLFPKKNWISSISCHFGKGKYKKNDIYAVVVFSLRHFVPRMKKYYSEELVTIPGFPSCSRQQWTGPGHTKCSRTEEDKTLFRSP